MRQQLELAIETGLCTVCTAGIFAFAFGVTPEGKINEAIFGAIVGAVGLWTLRGIASQIRFRKRPPDAP